MFLGVTVRFRVRVRLGLELGLEYGDSALGLGLG